MNQNRFYYPTSPKTNPESMVSGEKYRFSVLTPSLIRCEYDPNGRFEDRATQSVINREFPVVPFSVIREGGVLVLKTDALEITYCENTEFSGDTLSFHLLVNPGYTWRYGDEFEDLGGTAKTLDAVKGAILLGHGVCSRNGFSVIDDSCSVALGDDGWVHVREGSATDIYFFGHGHDYRAAVGDLYRLTGAPAMLPAYALGNWWSRYHKYTDEEYLGLLDRFSKERLPFSVAVIDMDWHTTEVPEEVKERDDHDLRGWTGYTWNREYFPDYKAFLKELHKRNVHTALNLHPADGVAAHEEMYPQMAEALGLDPENGKRIKFDCLNKNFLENYFDILHHPYEDAGVDFWWMDWQQGTDYNWLHEPNRDGKLENPLETIDPLWMLNRYHIADIMQRGKRPMFFSRFSGPGSARYSIGFSGDAVIAWESLKFQPYFTATASNIGYSQWSHDIGGHMMGYRDDELYVRWLQLGVLSPINRLHSCDDLFIHKEPWFYSKETEHILGDWLRFRHELFPYLYTMCYRNHHDLQPLVQPMYYEYPEKNAAYEAKNQYLFGSELMVSPITEPNDPISKLGRAPVWFPKGDWYDYFDGTRYHSDRPRNLDVFRPLERCPIFAKSGAIVPTNEFEGDSALKPREKLILTVFPGADNSFTLYEDSGEYSDFENGAFAKTEFSLKWGNAPVFTVHKPTGDCSLIPENRHYEVRFRGYSDKVAVTLQKNGKTTPLETTYDESTHTLSVHFDCPVSDDAVLTLTGEKIAADNKSLRDAMIERLEKAQITYRQKTNYLDVLKCTDVLRIQLWQPYTLASKEESGLMDALKELFLREEEEFADL